MRPIDADALKEQVESHGVSMSVCLCMEEHYGKVTMREDCLKDIANAHTIDVIPVDWMLQRMNETASGAGLNVELNNALFTVGVEWKRWKKEHADDA